MPTVYPALVPVFLGPDIICVAMEEGIEVHEIGLLGVDMAMKGRKRQDSRVGTGEMAQQLPAPASEDLNSVLSALSGSSQPPVTQL